MTETATASNTTSTTDANPAGPATGTDAAAHAAAASAAEAALGIRNRLVITLLLISTFIVILNETIMGVALPRLMSDLNITASAAQWLTSAFMLTMAVVIPITGFLLQRFNTRPVFIAAMTLFSTGTLIAALAPGFEVLLAARVVQATGTAIMFPLLLTTVMTLVPPAHLGRMMGNISIVISVAPAIGPTISGAILSVLDWRWMFILVLPIALTALIVGGILMKNVTTPTKTPIDVLSVILSALGFGGLVYGLSNLGSAGGIASVSGWLPLAVGALGLALFILRQLALQKRDGALLDLRTFRSRTFTFAIVMMAISMMALFGTIILLPIYMQTVLGLPALTTGLLLLPGGLVMGLLAPTVGRLYDRSGPTRLLVTGAVIVSAVFWAMTLLRSDTSQWWVLAAHVTLSFGLALLFTPLFTAGLAAVRPELYSHGSAMVGTVQQLAGAAGTALFVTVMASVAASRLAGGATDVAATSAGIHAAFLCGAVISLFAIPAAFFIRRAAPAVEGGRTPPV
ncbi:DHA2 family lincomycin resistance protein-like MFS transporter [Cryobacterium sp. MP_M5]|uniref:DHA2 family efflux MFS transporter permease subunit n=1 Tax=unclassified Cryobacterium TaxID=2649013 RepID=UPI0018C9BE0A|nr:MULTISPECIES: DHA2 family efflux MFS transporter permease subunit [unclassified Cryobacterium]MBG6058019.1 DHA2 family lincomycin resistance protein-like MFS transporter [Cryobacterium sp. MP_M3]MEC5176218.1 DHA2 family lincomycin resistance protein-like MFS transporter [Cryobacterium sp. MP_M5]